MYVFNALYSSSNRKSSMRVKRSLKSGRSNIEFERK